MNDDGFMHCIGSVLSKMFAFFFKKKENLSKMTVRDITQEVNGDNNNVSAGDMNVTHSKSKD